MRSTTSPAILLINTGSMVPGKASLGAWLSYGLGSMNENLPTFVVLNSKLIPAPGQPTDLTSAMGQRILCRAITRALRSARRALRYCILQDPPGMTRQTRRRAARLRQRREPKTLTKLGAIRRRARESASTRWPFACRPPCRSSLTCADEPASTWTLYGEEAKKPGTFANNCLHGAPDGRARRALHADLSERLGSRTATSSSSCPSCARDVDRACYGADHRSQARGMLDDTLVIWGGEFGRTVVQSGRTDEGQLRPRPPSALLHDVDGRRRRRSQASLYGETDDFSYNIVKDPVHVRDFNATMLHLLASITKD